MSYQHTDADEPATDSQDVSLFDLYGQAIFAYLKMHTSSREDAEDITMEVFLAAVKHDNLSEILPEDRLLWLRRVAHNKLIDHYRQATRHQVIGLEKVAENLLANDSRNPEHITLKQEMYAQLYRAISTLPTLQQQVLCLRYTGGLRFAEIAVLLNKREETVRKLLSRTLVTLRTLYSQPSVERR